MTFLTKTPNPFFLPRQKHSPSMQYNHRPVILTSTNKYDSGNRGIVTSKANIRTKTENIWYST